MAVMNAGTPLARRSLAYRKARRGLSWQLRLARKTWDRFSLLGDFGS